MTPPAIPEPMIMEIPAMRRGNPSGSLRRAKRKANGANKTKMQLQMIIQSQLSNKGQRIDDFAKVITKTYFLSIGLSP